MVGAVDVMVPKNQAGVNGVVGPKTFDLGSGKVISFDHRISEAKANQGGKKQHRE